MLTPSLVVAASDREGGLESAPARLPPLREELSIHEGPRVPSMGVAFLVMWPVLYTDTTEAWKLTAKNHRLRFGVAGVAAELTLAVIATVLWSFLSDGRLRSAVFFVAAVSWIVSVAINANPFMRWDGYYVLSDYLGVQNLQERGFAYARWVLREWLFNFGQAPPEHFSKRLSRTLLAYAYATWCYRLVLFIGIALLVYYLFFKLAGIVLMVVELVWFIGRPIARELTLWYDLRKSIKWTLQTGRTLLLLLASMLAVGLPWSTHIEGAEVMRDSPHTTVYPPRPSQLVRQGAARSLLARGWEATLVVLIRESGF